MTNCINTRFQLSGNSLPELKCIIIRSRILVGKSNSLLTFAKGLYIMLYSTSNIYISLSCLLCLVCIAICHSFNYTSESMLSYI
jgi:hypothetical protein